MVRATVTACGQAGAVFRTEAIWNMRGEDFVEDKIAQWVSDAGGKEESNIQYLIAGAGVVIILRSHISNDFNMFPLSLSLSLYLT